MAVRGGLERRRTLALAALAALVVAGAVLPASAATAGEAPPLRCPVGLRGPDVVGASVDQVIAAARRVEVDHRRAEVQGRWYRRTNVNTPVIEVVLLATIPLPPGGAALKRLAAKRCGRLAAQTAWAVVFHDGVTPMCCQYVTLFVIPTRHAFRVF